MEPERITALVAIVGDLVHGSEPMGRGRAEAIRDYCAEYDTAWIYARPELSGLDVVHAAAYSGMIAEDGSVTVAKSSQVVKKLGRFARLTHRLTVPPSGVQVQALTAIDLLQRYPLLLTAYPPGSVEEPAKSPKRRS